MDTPTILVVEDNPLNRELLVEILELAGYTVVVAENGETGLAMAREHRPALALVDLFLPGMDGLELTRRLQADPTTRTIPVVAVTAHAMAHNHQEALAAGCVDFITKPVDFQELLTKVARHLAGGPAAEPA